MQKPNWTGIIPAVLTHFNDDFTINFEETLKHIEYLLQNKADGIIALGTCGENNSLEMDEKLEVLEAICKLVDGRVPVICGVSELTTARATRYAKGAALAGVNGFMVLPPMAYTSCPRETVAHFAAVAEAAPEIPIMVYNCPAAYRVDMNIPILRELAKIESVVSVKEASGDTRRITDLFNEFGDRFEILAGLDDTALEAIALGAQGWISGTVNAFPREDHAIWTLCQEGRYKEAREIYRWYTPLLHMDADPKLVQLIKLMCVEVGIGNGTCRPPRLDLVGEEYEEAIAIIRKAIETRPDLTKYGFEPALELQTV